MPRILRHLNPDTRSRGFTFTKHDIAGDDFMRIDMAGAVWFVYQEEICPDTLRRHIQGAMWFKTARKLRTTFAKLPGFHVECAIGSAAQSLVYCTKIDTRAPNARAKVWGVMPEQGKRVDTEDVHTAIKEGAPDDQLWIDFPQWMNQYHRSAAAFRRTLYKPRKVMTKVRVYWGDTGTGKSYAAQRDAAQLAGGDDNWEVFPCKELDSEKTWFDGCAGKRVVVIDEFEGEIGFRLLLRMLDWTRMRGAVKGAFEHWAPEWVIITSNFHPKKWYTRPYEGGPLERRLTEGGSYLQEFKVRYDAARATAIEVLEILDVPMYNIEDAQPAFDPRDLDSDSDVSEVASLD